MDFTTLKSIQTVYPKYIKQYKDILLDPSSDVETKIDTIVQSLNRVSANEQQLANNWNQVMQWAMNDGLDAAVSTQIAALEASGYFDSLLTSLFNSELGTETLATASQDIKGAINEVKGVADSNTSALADITTFVNVKSYGAIGDGISDDTQSFINAFNYASTNKLNLYVPKGTYLIKQNITVTNDSIPMIFGDNQGKSILLFDGITGYALTINTYYTKPFRIKNLTIQQKDATQTFNGVSVVYPTGTQWGGCVLMDNVNVTGFTGIVLNMLNSYGCRFNDSTFQGGQQGTLNVAKLLRIQMANGQFSNMNRFDNCTFGYGHIGVQNLGGIEYSFEGCIFTGLDLFMHSPLVSGIDSSRISFKECWFETITKGILNADINESALTANSPVTNKLDLKNMYFNNNNAIGTPTYILDSTIEPINYAYSQFFLFNGYRVNVTNLPLAFQTLTLPSGWTGSVSYAKNSSGTVTVYASIQPGGAVTDLTTLCNLPTGYRPFANMVVPIMDTPNGGYSGMGLYIATNGNLTVPAGQGSKFNSAYTYKFQVTYYFGS